MGIRVFFDLKNFVVIFSREVSQSNLYQKKTSPLIHGKELSNGIRSKEPS